MTYYKNIYFTILPIPFMASSMFGMLNGINYGYDNKKNHFESFSGMVRFTSLGMITGISYPILAGYILYNKIKED